MIAEFLPVTLHRPKALNSLSTQLMRECQDALRSLDAESEVGAIVLTGSEKAFAGIITTFFAVIALHKFRSIPAY